MSIKTKILLTGGSGFIGKSLLPILLQHGFEVLAPTSKELNLLDQASVRNFIEIYQNDYKLDVVHCATVGGRYGIQDHSEVYDINMQIFSSLVYLLNSVNTKFNQPYTFINFGSGAEFNSVSNYGRAKRDVKSAGANLYCGTHRTNYFHLRIFGCFGLLEEKDRFIKSALTNYINRMNIIVHQNRLFDFVFIEDVISVICHILRGDAIGENEFEMVYSEKRCLNDVANFVNNLSNYKVDIATGEEGMGPPYIGCNNSTFEKIVSGNRIGLFKGIEKVYHQLLSQGGKL